VHHIERCTRTAICSSIRAFDDRAMNPVAASQLIAADWLQRRAYQGLEQPRYFADC